MKNWRVDEERCYYGYAIIDVDKTSVCDNSTVCFVDDLNDAKLIVAAVAQYTKENAKA